MERDIQLIEENPYYPNETPGVPNTEMRWRSHYEIEEWSYDQGYDCGVSELWKILPTDIVKDIGMVFIREGPEAAEVVMEEEITQTVDVITNEYLSSYVDGQMRLVAGYDVAENGDTLGEGDYGIWEDLRIMWEAGFRDKLRGDERYSSIS